MHLRERENERERETDRERGERYTKVLQWKVMHLRQSPLSRDVQTSKYQTFNYLNQSQGEVSVISLLRKFKRK